jgi:hypothetical protein
LIGFGRAKHSNAFKKYGLQDELSDACVSGDKKLHATGSEGKSSGHAFVLFNEKLMLAQGRP